MGRTSGYVRSVHDAIVSLLPDRFGLCLSEGGVSGGLTKPLAAKGDAVVSESKLEHTRFENTPWARWTHPRNPHDNLVLI